MHRMKKKKKLWENLSKIHLRILCFLLLGNQFGCINYWMNCKKRSLSFFGKQTKNASYYNLLVRTKHFHLHFMTMGNIFLVPRLNKWRNICTGKPQMPQVLCAEKMSVRKRVNVDFRLWVSLFFQWSPFPVCTIDDNKQTNKQKD